MSILVTGARGQLGQLICRQLGPIAMPADRASLDITNRESVLRRVAQTAPTAIINCAAYTAVDDAESNPERCYAVNVLGVKYLAEAANELGSLLVHVSTDYVFHGQTVRTTPFRESDVVQPHSVYAKSKAEGEVAAASADKSLVVRTCGLYSHVGHNFVSTMLRLSQTRSELQVVNDQHCTPSNAEDVAQAVCFLTQADARGIYHVVNTGQTAWCEFAREIFRLKEIPITVEPISSAQFGAAAARPPYSVLDTTKYHSLTDAPPMPTWGSALQKHFLDC